ncbi:hypothetical protein DFP72DRAFT_918490 [Ephemerocybe angulata]|uniref:Uncharacterized protein n=1 Tax=Ephemerocybe angulata TaxID=980116 RepID=A0A8H6LYS2_9AGAR|nr:hypothetical protein DFP72DRAFT_918490 [Tulosesus angulatus]
MISAQYRAIYAMLGLWVSSSFRGNRIRIGRGLSEAALSWARDDGAHGHSKLPKAVILRVHRANYFAPWYLYRRNLQFTAWLRWIAWPRQRFFRLVRVNVAMLSSSGEKTASLGKIPTLTQAKRSPSRRNSEGSAATYQTRSSQTRIVRLPVGWLLGKRLISGHIVGRITRARLDYELPQDQAMASA